MLAALLLTPTAEAALLRALAGGQTLPELLTGIVEAWAKGG